MFLLRNHFLLHETPKHVPEVCKVLLCHMSSSKHVSVTMMPPLSKQMITKGFKHEEVHQLHYRMKGVYGVLEMAKRGQVEQADQLFKKLLKVRQLKLGVGVCISMFDMHVKAGNVQEAVDALQRLHSLHPQVILQPYKVLNFATLLLKRGQTEQCVQLLRDEARDESRHSHEQLEQQQWATDGRANIMDRLCHQLLQTAADCGNAELTRQLMDELLHLGYCTVSRALLAPLVRVHLVRSDLKAALQVLEEVAMQHRCLPCKAELLLELVTHHDAESLTRLMDLSSAVIGRPQAVFDLAIALIEAGQLDKSARVIKEEQVRLDTERLQYLCKVYVSSRKPQHLRGLATLLLVSGAASGDQLMVKAHLFLCLELVGETKAANELLQELEKEGVTKKDILDRLPVVLLQLRKDKATNKAVAELPSPFLPDRQTTNLQQRSRSDSREVQVHDKRSRSNSLSRNASFHSADNTCLDQRSTRRSARALWRDGPQEMEESPERSYDSEAHFERQKRNNRLGTGNSGSQKTSRRRPNSAAVLDLW